MAQGKPGWGVHVAIIAPEFVPLFLGGGKSIEARFSKIRRAPYGRVHAGERVYFKRRGGGYFAVSQVLRVLTLSELNPEAVEDVRDAFGGRILGPDAFWESVRDRRYATLITLKDIEATQLGPDLDKWVGAARRSGWHALPARAEPARMRKRRSAA